MSEVIEVVPSTRSAAVLLLALGESAASEILKHMDSKIVQRLGVEMAGLKTASNEEVTAVVGSFVSAMSDRASIEVGSDEYIKKILTSALGDEKASTILDRILLGRTSSGLDVLKYMEPKAIAEIIRQEPPQVLAILLAYLDTDMAARVLELFPDWLQAEIVMRIATLDGIQPSALHTVDEMIEKQFNGKAAGVAANLGGPKAAAGILNFIDSTGDGKVIAQIRKADEVLCQRLQDLMFVFEDLLEIDDRGIQELLREVDTNTLVLALKAAVPAMREKFLSNMSQRAAEMLKDDLESRGPVKLSEVEGSQKLILKTVRKLAEDGRIILQNTGEEFV